MFIVEQRRKPTVIPFQRASERVELTGSSDYNERNDCTVRAWAIVTGDSYADSHALMARYGRRRRCAMRDCVRVPRRDSRFTDLSDTARGMTLNRFVKQFPSGKFLVRVRGHVLAVIGGVVVDHSPGPRRKVTHAYKFTAGV